MVDFVIGDRRVGPDTPAFIIAEIGVNHNGDEELARRMIDAAVKAGADAVKFQTFSAERLATAEAATADYQRENTGLGSQLELLRNLELDEWAHERLLNYCRRTDIVFLSSPFDLDSIDLLERLEVPAFKVPSPDCISTRYLQHMGSKGRPVILSTGMCDIGEVAYGVLTLREAGAPSIAVLHCTSCYPAPVDELNLNAMATIAKATQCLVGYSDHSDTIAVPIASVVLGGRIVEKHLTLDRTMPGPDHRASIEPDVFETMVNGIRAAEAALGGFEKRPQPSERSARLLGRRSLASVRALSEGHQINADDLCLLRPSGGIEPRFEEVVVGRRLRRAVPPLTLLEWNDV